MCPQVTCLLPITLQYSDKVLEMLRFPGWEYEVRLAIAEAELALAEYLTVALFIDTHRKFLVRCGAWVLVIVFQPQTERFSLLDILIHDVTATAPQKPEVTSCPE